MSTNVGILFPQSPFSRGGAELFVEELSDKLKKRGYNTDIITIPFKWHPLDQLYNQMLVWRGLDFMEYEGRKIDYIIGTKFPSYFAKHPNKVLWLIHQHRSAYDMIDSVHSPFRDKPVEAARFRETDTKILKESKHIFTISKNVTNRLKKYNNIDSKPIYHPPKLYQYYRNEQFDDYIFTASRLNVSKRIHLLIEAMQYVNRNVKCLIGGVGMEVTNLNKLIEKNDLGNRVKLLGYIDEDELIRLYANSLGVYFAPLDEDYGYITLETFFSKKPVITAYDSGGVLEFVEDEKSGFITEPSPRKIAESINKLYDDKKNARDMGVHGYNQVKNITWDNAMDVFTESLKG